MIGVAPSATRVAVLREPTDDDLARAATIWADAAARRDGLDRPEPWTRTLVGIRTRMALPGATLFLAARADQSTGFALAAPDGSGAELYYLAVHPDTWGSGTAAALLAEVERWAHDLQATELVLWVLDDNLRAHAAYARAGWAVTDERQVARPSGRLERRLTLTPGARRAPLRS